MNHLNYAAMLSPWIAVHQFVVVQERRSGLGGPARVQIPPPAPRLDPQASVTLSSSWSGAPSRRSRA